MEDRVKPEHWNNGGMMGRSWLTVTAESFKSLEPPCVELDFDLFLLNYGF